MNLKETQAAIRAAVEARLPVLLWGAPGVGKTAVIEQIAESLDAGFVPLAVSTRMPEDFSGLPVPGPDGVSQEPLSWLRRAIRLAEQRKGGCVVLLDEFSCNAPSLQAALLSLVQSRYCGDTEIPRRVAFVAAANPVAQAADGWELPAPTVSRWVHLPFPRPSAAEWTGWLLNGSVRAYDEGTPWAGQPGDRARSLVAAFLHRSPSALYSDAQPGSTGTEAYACPRSWEAATRLLALRVPPTVEQPLVEGAIGRGVATAFFGWLVDADLPDPEVLLDHPERWRLPQGRADRVMASLLGCVAAVAHHPSDERYEQLIELFIRARDVAAGVVALSASQAVQSPAIAKLKLPPRFDELGEIAAVANRMGVI